LGEIAGCRRTAFAHDTRYERALHRSEHRDLRDASEWFD
jgi:hypothetical protein